MSADLCLKVVVFYVSIHNTFRQACDFFDEFNLTHISFVIQTFCQIPFTYVTQTDYKQRAYMFLSLPISNPLFLCLLSSFAVDKHDVRTDW